MIYRFSRSDCPSSYQPKERLLEMMENGKWYGGELPRGWSGVKKEAKKGQDNLDIIAVPAEDVFFFQDVIMKKVSDLAKKDRRVYMVVDGCAATGDIYGMDRIEYSFKTADMLRLWDLNHDLKNTGLAESIKFNEFFVTTKYSDLETCWNFEQVLDANNELVKIVQRIDHFHLSPYEAMVYIHKYLTQAYEYGFHVNEKFTNITKNRYTEKNRSIVSAVLGKKTVCSGFASMTKAIIDKLQMPGLSCRYKKVQEYTHVNQEKIKSLGGHALVSIEIEDPKYNISGIYLDDATWDCKTEEFPYGRGYVFFMYSVREMAKLSSPLTFVHDCWWGGRTKSKVVSAIFPIGEDIESDPIPFDVFEKAVKKVYSLECDFCRQKKPDDAAAEDILTSLNLSFDSRIDGDNPLIKKFNDVYEATPVYDENDEIKYVNVVPKNQTANSDMERIK